MRDYQRRYSMVSLLLTGLAMLLDRWPLLLLAAFLISSEGPHIRLSYSYMGPISNPWRMDDCLYLGSRGLITPRYGYMEDCPFIAWIDVEEAAL